jgi:hypothetical protein
VSVVSLFSRICITPTVLAISEIFQVPFKIVFLLENGTLGGENWLGLEVVVTTGTV